MKISSSFDSSYSSQNRRSFKGIPSNPVYLPEWIGKAGKWAGEYISMPEQKLFLATTAFLFQPAIDMKYAEEDKKSDVAIKSASKAIAGGITGVTIRAGFEKFFKSKIGYTPEGVKKANVINDYLFPPKASKLFEKSKTEAETLLNKYCSTLSMMIALVVMSFITNEKIDVPLTSDLQDIFTGVARDGKSWSQSFKDVGKIRLGKIKNWFNKKKAFFKRFNDKTKRIVKIIKENDNKTTQKSKKHEGGK